METFLKSSHFKVSLLLTLSMAAVVCSSAYGVMDDCSNESWHLYKTQFQKQYGSTVEDARRRLIFCNNMHMIYAHNERYKRGEVTFEMGVNQFADLTTEEFRRWLHGGSIGGGGGVVGESFTSAGPYSKRH
ncbi:protein CTLA-2-beta [Anastrepha ludens]|uniref:protein CTLA-2-beta n=1 Tax=Anastrepha ludens TaxID=28586 RepID=UPI0023B07EFD|nr:protein CTLA-2-beta [Anastrepha ludens]